MAMRRRRYRTVPQPPAPQPHIGCAQMLLALLAGVVLGAVFIGLLILLADIIY